MPFPIPDVTPATNHSDHVRALVTKAAQGDNGLEAVQFAQAALTVAQALGQLAFEKREQENHDNHIKASGSAGHQTAAS